MKRYFSLCALFVIFCSFYSTNLSASHLELNKSSYVGFPNTLKEKDFFTTPFVSSDDQEKSFSSLQLLSCRDNIKEVICLVDPVKAGESLTTRPCQEGGEAYAIYFENLYDNYPPALQKMFCSLKHIYVEKKYYGTAYSSVFRTRDNKTNGGFIGIRQSVLDASPSLSDWASWKEQLSFGGITNSYASTPGLPQVTASSNSTTNDFIYFIITHEFGHLFDFANNLNQDPDCSTEHECVLSKDTWSTISWESYSKAKPKNEFKNRSALCFYECLNGTINRADIPELYESLAKTDFISTYAATQMYDDFAETLAYYMMDQKMLLQYLIDTQQGGTYNPILKLKDPIFETKAKYLRNFLSKPDILYP